MITSIVLKAVLSVVGYFQTSSPHSAIDFIRNDVVREVSNLQNSDVYLVSSCTADNLVVEFNNGSSLDPTPGEILNAYSNAVENQFNNRNEFASESIEMDCNNCNILYRKIVKVEEVGNNGSKIIATTRFATFSEVFPSGSYHSSYANIPIEPALGCQFTEETNNDNVVSQRKVTMKLNGRKLTTASPVSTPPPTVSGSGNSKIVNLLCMNTYNFATWGSLLLLTLFVPCGIPAIAAFGFPFGARVCEFEGFGFPWNQEEAYDGVN